MLDGVKTMLCDGFYFSYGYDLTCSRQRRITWMQKKDRSDPLKLIASDHNYFWNKALYRDLIAQKVDCRWLTPLIQGYFGQVSGRMGGCNITITLMSRRMHHNTGTRYNARGINDKGYVGNQCETE